MTILVTGSIAYDYLMTFPGRFREHILLDKLDSISLSFLVDDMRRQRGGCAPNIAYSLALLGERPRIVGTAGCDFATYRAWLEEQGVDTSGIVVYDDLFTASFFVSTDLDGNQIASFYTGAMARARELSIKEQNPGDVELVIISPNDPQAMSKYVRECQELGIPYIYDPSQQIVRLSGAELIEGMRGARLLIVNDYEFELIQRRTELSAQEVRELSGTVIITRGEQGSVIMTGDERIEIPAAPPRQVVDPTGVGDAYRAGVIKGLLHGMPWPITGRIASLAATYVVETLGPQSHHYTLEEFAVRYRETFGPAPELEKLLQVTS